MDKETRTRLMPQYPSHDEPGVNRIMALCSLGVLITFVCAFLRAAYGG